MSQLLPLACPTAPNPARPPSKNRVGGSPRSSALRAPKTRSQLPESHRVLRPAATTTASGRPVGPNRDPIGERGGVNLAAFVRNTSVNSIDKLGLRCCLITMRAGGEGENRSLSGHSMLACDDGYYMSWNPGGFPSYFPGVPWPGDNKEVVDDWGPGGHYGEIISGDLLEDGTITTTHGREATVVCLDCLHGYMMPLAQQGNLWGCSWNPLNNCADEALRAIDEALDQPPPRCRCDQRRVNLLGRSIMFETPRSAEEQVRDLRANGCNKWRCIRKFPRLPHPSSPLERGMPGGIRWDW